MDRELVREIIVYKGQFSFIVMATIIATEGSSPRNTGAQMLIYPDGDIKGSIGGGPVEADIIKKAKKLIKNRDIKDQVKKYHYDMFSEEAAPVGGVCGGSVDVLLEVLELL